VILGVELAGSVLAFILSRFGSLSNVNILTIVLQTDTGLELSGDYGIISAIMIVHCYVGGI